ncbi:MAG: triosephosphate isomerase [Candidatus Parcubacteria bacterium]|jgi:triosephosphate isomerase|nr:triosephosphate isomerase [Candidatus Parcubacteria bacterium]
MTTKKLVVGNWKMNPQSLEDAKRIARKTRAAAAKLKATEAVICPPFVFISACAPRRRASHFYLGAQSVSFERDGPHTGQIGAPMLKDIGADFVIAGHSEVRAEGETDADVSKEAKAILEAGMTPIICVGEQKRDESGAHFDFVREQIKGSLADIPKKFSWNIVIAYEPIWAIGAEEAMGPEAINEMSIFVKKIFADIFGTDSAMKVAVLYGGSVHSRNAADILKIGRVDGLLVGRESVSSTGFVELLTAVDLSARTI